MSRNSTKPRLADPDLVFRGRIPGLTHRFNCPVTVSGQNTGLHALTSSARRKRYTVPNGIKIRIHAGFRPCMAAGEPALRTRHKGCPEAFSGVGGSFCRLTQCHCPVSPEYIFHNERNACTVAPGGPFMGTGEGDGRLAVFDAPLS